MRIKEIKNDIELIRALFKLVVPSLTVLYVIHISLLLFEVDELFGNLLRSTIGFILLYKGSQILGLCKSFRLNLIFIYIMDLCMLYQREIEVFGEYIIYARILMLVFGIICLLLLIKKI